MMETLLALFILLQYADGWTTYRILKRDGRELNPVLAKLFDEFGVLPSLVVIKSACVAAAVWMYAEDQFIVLAFVAAIYGAFVANNMRQMYK